MYAASLKARMTEVISAAAVLLPLHYCLATCQMLLHSTSCVWRHDGQAAAFLGTLQVRAQCTSKPHKLFQALQGTPVTQLLTRLQSPGVTSDQLQKAG